MSDLLAPGDERAGDLMSDRALLTALVTVEQAWLGVLAGVGLAPAGPTPDLHGLVREADLPGISRAAEQGGNPVIPLVSLLRERLAATEPEHARWLHRGLTSQDVVDTALALCLREVAARVAADVRTQVAALSGLARDHRSTLQAGRTLTQHAVPSTFGLTAAGWLHGVLDAAEDLAGAAAALPVQVGGAAGTLAATTELLAGTVGAEGAPASSRALVGDLAGALGLVDAPPWHTRRRPLTRVADALVACLDAYGTIAADVLVRVRPEVAELGEPVAGGRGGSSTMPHKQNPVLSVLVRGRALGAPAHAAVLHAAAACAVDDRPDGAWQAEWPALRALGRSAPVASSLTAELLTGLVVHPDRMRATAEAGRRRPAGRAALAGLPDPSRPRRLPRRRRPARRRGPDPGRDLPGGPPVTTPPTAATTTNDGSLRVAVHDLGGSGPLLLLGPSLGTSVRTLWGACADALTDRFHVVGWDLPGHGGSASATGFDVAGLAAAVLAEADRLTDEPFHHAGDSAGGAVGLQLLLDAPGRVASAVVACSGARIGSAPMWADRAAAVRDGGTRVLLEATPGRWFGPGFAEREPAVTATLLDDLETCDDEGYAAVCEALATYDVRDRLHEVTTPVLAVAGADDSVTPTPSLRHVADGVRRGRLVVLPGTGHLAPAEQPVAVARLICENADRAAAYDRQSPARTFDQARAEGMRVRREVLGDAHVERASAGVTALTAEFQDLITTYAWGTIWTRPGLDRRSRSLVTLTALVARGHHEELAMHLRAARTNGLSVAELTEVLLQAAVYCGVPDANTAFRIAGEVLGEET